MTLGYGQVGMEQHSQEKTAFRMYARPYEFWKMPLELVNASAMFQRLTEVVLSGLACENCMVYLVDVLVV